MRVSLRRIWWFPVYAKLRTGLQAMLLRREHLSGAAMSYISLCLWNDSTNQLVVHEAIDLLSMSRALNSEEVKPLAEWHFTGPDNMNVWVGVIRDLTGEVFLLSTTIHSFICNLSCFADDQVFYSSWKSSLWGKSFKQMDTEPITSSIEDVILSRSSSMKPPFLAFMNFC